MSAPGGASLLVVLLTVSVVVKVIDAQVCQDITTCGTNYTSAGASAGLDKDKLCKAANVYLTCLEAAAKKCGVNVNNTVGPARGALSQAGCLTDAQGCQDITTCGTNYGPALASAGQDKDKICKAANVYLTCLEAAAKKCGVNVNNTVGPARRALSQAGCLTDAQGCQDITTCGTNYGPALASAGQDKDKICKAANVYLTCLEAAAKKCGLDIDKTVGPARKALSQAGCSGSGAPVLSFVAMVLGVVIYLSF